jgi:MFS family permease
VRARRPGQDLTSIWAGTPADPSVTGRRVDAWLRQGDRLAIFAVVACALLWLAYGAYGATVFGSTDQSAAARLTWVLPAALSVATAVGIGSTTPGSRGLVFAAAVAAGSALGLLAGILLGGGFASGADDAAYVSFVALLTLLVAAGWLAGAVVGRLLRRRTDLLDRKRVPVFFISAIAALLSTAFVLGQITASGEEGRQWSGSSRQAVPDGEVDVVAAWWDAPAHAYLPRLGATTVAIGVAYEAGESELRAARRAWLARDQDGQAYDAIIWPNRRPLRKIGQPLADQVVPPGGAAGWFAFVVPPSVEWLDVVLETDDGPRTWRVDAEGGARVAS